MAIVQNPLLVRLFINTAKNGWSERWAITETDWSRGLNVALLLAQARSRVLSSSCKLVWASLATIMPPYIEQYVAGPLLPLPQWGATYFDMSGLYFYFDSGQGFGMPRIFRGMETIEIIERRWVYAGLDVPLVIPTLPSPVTLATKQQLWQNTLATFRTYCGYLTPLNKADPSSGDGFSLLPYSTAYFQEPGSRRVGRPWQYMSWEPQDYDHRPNFSPCGEIVTVLRFSYQIPCDFGQGFPATGIHYYNARAGATIFTEPTIFYGWARAKENVIFSGPGETRKERRTDWTNGREYGLAPGTAFRGYPAQFLGYGPPYYGGDIKRPTPTMPTCDEPIECGITADDGFTWITADDGMTVLTAECATPPLNVLTADDGITWITADDGVTIITAD